MVEGFLRGFVGMVFFFFVASAITGIGCMGAFVGCVAVFDNIASNSSAAKTTPCPLPERSEVPIVAEPQETAKEDPPKKSKKTRRKEAEAKVEEPKEDVLTPEEEDLYHRIREAEDRMKPEPVPIPEGILPPAS